LRSGDGRWIRGTSFARCDFPPFVGIQIFPIFRRSYVFLQSPRTLIDTAMRKCSGDIKELKPTFFLGVPTILDRLFCPFSLCCLSPFLIVLFPGLNEVCWTLSTNHRR